MIEMQRLREGLSRPEHSAVQGRLTISDIKLPLKSAFMSQIGSANGKLLSCTDVMFKYCGIQRKQFMYCC